MKEKNIKLLEAFGQHLRSSEKSRNTVEKYIRDVRKFLNYYEMETSEEQPIRSQILEYKEYLGKSYKVSSANSMIIALNAYLRFIGRPECCVRTFRMQKQIFRDADREITRDEYKRLVQEARNMGNDRLSHILQTVSSTGIRISELPFITVEALKRSMVTIQCKGKVRVIVLPRSLTILLGDYCRRMNIRRGSVFITKNGRPVDRRNIWREMKQLCAGAGVTSEKVFPHNLRHLFARCYYEKERDLVRLADYLGHSSVDTTRRYTMITSMEAYLKQLELGMVILQAGGTS